MPDTWYAGVVALLAPHPSKVAVDTSDRPLAALVDGLDRGSPDLIKPNAEELAGVIGLSPQALEAAVAQGDPEPVVLAAQRLVDRGIGAVLATLGASGAVLVNAAGSWLATPPPIEPRSTVGAGDSSLAGYVRADIAGLEPSQRLQMAVAYGSAAAALPGSALPSPAEIDLDAVAVKAISLKTARS
jgi:1-phosphofructokinase